MKFPPAVVYPCDRPASLGIARSLGRRGIPVFGIDTDALAYGLASKYVKPCLYSASSDSEEYRLHFLIDLAKQIGGKAILYPVSDDIVMLCSQYRDELQKHYLYVMPDHETIRNLLTKDGLHRVAQAHGIPNPRMFQVGNHTEVEKIAKDLPYPVIIKPVFSPSWLRPEINSLLRDSALGGAPKVAFCRDSKELLEKYRMISTYDTQVIVEEVIPGEDQRLVYFCFYLDRQSRPLAIFAGEKLRVLPVGFGSATYVRSFHDPQLDDVSLKLLSETCYQGLGGIEFKRDSRDERYKLIEFNARLGMWDCLGISCGVDIPYIAYCDALGLSVEKQHKYREGILWIDFQRDLRAFFIYHRCKQLSLTMWLSSLRGKKDWAIYSSDDWKPALIALLQLFCLLWNFFMKRLQDILHIRNNNSLQAGR